MDREDEPIRERSWHEFTDDSTVERNVDNRQYGISASNIPDRTPQPCRELCNHECPAEFLGKYFRDADGQMDFVDPHAVVQGAEATSETLGADSELV